MANHRFICIRRMPADTMSRTRWKAKLQAASALTKVTLLLFSPHKYWIVDGKTLTFKATGGNKVNRCQYFRPNVQRLKAIRKSIEFEDSIKLTFITGQVRNAASKKRTDFPLWGFYIATANVCSWCNYSIGHGWDLAMKAFFWNFNFKMDGFIWLAYQVNRISVS